MFKKAGVLFLYTETPLHPGTGASVGAVDLPIQRERHTHYPIIQASGVKGALRDLAYAIFGISRGTKDERIEVVFGPETERASEHGGALALTDARVLLFPVRSIQGVFTWITCPTVIERFKRDLRLLKTIDECLSNPSLDELEKIQLPVLGSKARQAGTPSGSEVVLDNDQIILEDFCFKVVDEDKRKQVAQFAQWLSKHALPRDLEHWKKKLQEGLVLLSDDDFSEFTQFATEVITRIKLGEKGTVETGGLWDEEHLPSETLLYSLALATGPKVEIDKDKPEVPKNAAEVLEFLQERLVDKAQVMQFGGDETVGKGLVRVHFFDNKEVDRG